CLGPPAPERDLPDPLGDILKPVLVSMSLSPSTADVTTADAIISVSLHITDDKSGASPPSLSWISEEDHFGHEFVLNLASGDANDGVWTGEARIPRGTKARHYPLYFGVQDRVDNSLRHTATDLKVLGLPSGFDITAADHDE